MDKLMETLYDYILDNTLEEYYGATDYYAQRQRRDEAGRALWERLPPEHRELLEEVQRSYGRTEGCELEAMFLASFDQWSALLRSHGGLRT